jgi:hypothetical protein
MLKSCCIGKRGFILVGGIHFKKVYHSVELQFEER